MSPAHATHPAAWSHREARSTSHAALLPRTPPYLYLLACRPSLSVSVTVLPQQVQGCAQQQDRNGGQSQDHQHILYHFLWAEGKATTQCVHAMSGSVWDP